MKAKLLGAAVAVGLLVATAGTASAQVYYSSGYAGYPGSYYTPSVGTYIDPYASAYSYGSTYGAAPYADVSSYTAYGYAPYNGWNTAGYTGYVPAYGYSTYSTGSPYFNQYYGFSNYGYGNYGVSNYGYGGRRGFRIFR